MKHIGFTGTRKELTEAQKRVLRTLIAQAAEVADGLVAHHGDCVGADAFFHEVCQDNKIPIVIHPPDNPCLQSFCEGDETRPAKSYLARNQDIVNESNVMFAAPGENREVLRSGTWSTIRKARTAKKQTCIIFPSGHCVFEN